MIILTHPLLLMRTVLTKSKAKRKGLVSIKEGNSNNTKVFNDWLHEPYLLLEAMSPRILRLVIQSVHGDSQEDKQYMNGNNS
jgi:hypothetical protein